MVTMMMSLSLCFSARNSGVPVTQSASGEFEVIVEHSVSRSEGESRKRRWSHRKKAGTEVWFGRTAEDIPSHDVAELSRDVFASYSGPDKGLAIIPDLQPVNNLENGHDKDANCNRSNDGTVSTSGGLSSSPEAKDNVAGVEGWNSKSRKSYGISMSLYEQHPINGKISGEPIADSFGICSRTNNSVMIVADGVNWGEKSKLAARCAIYGSMNYINEKIFGDNKSISTTQESFQVLLEAINQAHQTIIQYGGGQTTLCMALVLPLKESRQFAVCIVNVGDSLAYVFSKYHGIREITTGSHDIRSERDIRDAGGAVGPVHGNDPELHNLTCSMTLVDPGDVVYLTTDGISDNFDPVVTKIAVASRRRHSDPHLQALPEEGPADSGRDGDGADRTVGCGTLDGKPEMEPHERHQYAVKEMERIVHEFELFTEQPCSAQELCGALLQHVLKLTDPKRKVLENPDLYGKKLRSKDRKRRDSEIIAKLSKSPGKLDHATIVGYEVGVYRGDDDDDYEVLSEEEQEEEEASDEDMSEARNSVSNLPFDSPSPVAAPSADSNRVHDALFACDNDSSRAGGLGQKAGSRRRQALSPESQKKKNSLRNLRLRVRSHFRSPGHKTRSAGQTSSPDGPGTDPSSPTDGQLAGSEPDPDRAERVLELRQALGRQRDEQTSSGADGRRAQSPTGQQPAAASGTPPPSSPPQSQTTLSPTSRRQPPSQGRVQGRRAQRRAQQQRRPVSSPVEPIPLSKPEVQRPSHRTQSDSLDDRRTVPNPGDHPSSPEAEPEKDLWIIRPKLSEAASGVQPAPHWRRKHATDSGRMSRHQPDGKQPERTRPAAKPKPEDVAPKQRPTSDSRPAKESPESNADVSSPGLTYKLPRLLEVCTEDEIFV